MEMRFLLGVCGFSGGSEPLWLKLLSRSGPIEQEAAGEGDECSHSEEKPIFFYFLCAKMPMSCCLFTYFSGDFSERKIKKYTPTQQVSKSMNINSSI